MIELDLKILWHAWDHLMTHHCVAAHRLRTTALNRCRTLKKSHKKIFSKCFFFGHLLTLIFLFYVSHNFFPLQHVFYCFNVCKITISAKCFICEKLKLLLAIYILPRFAPDKSQYNTISNKNTHLFLKNQFTKFQIRYSKDSK